MKTKSKFAAAIFGAALVLGACGGGNDDSASGDKDGGNVDADKVYQANCATCHGGNLEGKNGPELAHIGKELKEDEIHDIIENGKSGGMPGGLIKGEELDAVAKWLSEKK
ncbi:cytochrome c-551 [Sporosarcina sp. NCCP-2716]|uniref:cytochrome c551 n=1 Tax=Sporosarcina sp. NCCP-2716 TaxID=2943679 RepID=UPI0020422513|nr:cytochrome c [Sporosarcina sp. NCCP-2716]GKV67544.1 cytochrome c-551 [Sporosarcina sp. NCCP-2716]